MSTFSFEFILDGQRQSPDSIVDFTGYFNGPCRIVNCHVHPNLVGQLKTLSISNIISINPSFTYKTTCAIMKNGRIEMDKNEMVIVIGLKPTIGQVELDYIYEEIGIQYEVRNTLTRPIIDENNSWMFELRKLKTFKPEELMKVERLAPLIENASDLLRLQYIQPLSLFFVDKKDKLGEEQREHIRKLSSEKLKKLTNSLQTTPWELAFREKTLPMDALVRKQYERACVNFKVIVPRHVSIAMRIYYTCYEQMIDQRDTFFTWDPRKQMSIIEYETLLPDVICFLETYILTWLDVEKTRFALKREYSEAKVICQSLMRTAYRASMELVELRDHNVPKKPPQLTHDQQSIANHICQNYLTIVEGLPGTGKTVLIEWVMCTMKNVLLCSLTGMMAKSLRLRMGNRDEAAHTIEHLNHVAKHVEIRGKAWLERFDVLVIDEFSNTNTSGLATLLRYLPNLKRIVLVGDHEQIGPIEQGDAMGDFKLLYQQGGHAFKLTEILRVQKNLEDLSMAPLLMSQGQHRRLVFREEGPLTLIEPKSTFCATREDPTKFIEIPPDRKAILKNILTQVFTLKRSLMAHQILVLQNDLRRDINLKCQEICIELGLITPANANRANRIGSHNFYVGSKITFTQNYNKQYKYPIGKKKKARKGEEKESFLVSDIVANGETGVITKIQTYDSIICIEFTDNDTPNSNAVVKQVLVYASGGGVKAKDIDLGYATTTTKAQGREFDYAIFYNNKNPQYCWTRPHVYVALSRGKKRVWCVSTASDLYKICDRPSKPRDTILSHLLQVCSTDLLRRFVTKAFPIKIFNPQTRYTILPLSVPCVPTLEEEVKEEEEQADL